MSRVVRNSLCIALMQSVWPMGGGVRAISKGPRVGVPRRSAIGVRFVIRLGVLLMAYSAAGR